MVDILKKLIPSTITILGLALGLIGIQLLPSRPALILLLVSLICDVFDGYLARKLGARTRFGRELDWITDCVLAHIAATQINYGVNAALVIWQSYTKSIGIKSSGRLIMFIIIAADKMWRLF
jgi:phosphatidylserine synthase